MKLMIGFRICELVSAALHSRLLEYTRKWWDVSQFVNFRDYPRIMGDNTTTVYPYDPRVLHLPSVGHLGHFPGEAYIVQLSFGHALPNFICWQIDPTKTLSMCPSTYLSTYLSIYLSPYLSTYLPISIYLSIYLSTYLYLFTCTCLSTN